MTDILKDLDKAIDIGEKLHKILDDNTRVMAEREAFERWFSSEQGYPYETMWAFSKAAWKACATQKDERIKELEADVLQARNMLDDAEREIERLESESEALAVQVWIARTELDRLARLGNGNSYGNSNGNCIAQDALKKLDGNAEAILRQRDARVLCGAAKLVRDDLCFKMSEGSPHRKMAHAVVEKLRNMAELENNK